jgi:hypothetical protein
MALSAALPLGPGILWRGFDRCRASPEGIESASGASSSAFCFPGESERLNKHWAPKSESPKDYQHFHFSRWWPWEEAELYGHFFAKLLGGCDVSV